MPRCFFSLSLPYPVSVALGTCAGSLHDTRFKGAGLRLVDIRDLHVTLRFLGKVDAALVPALIDGMNDIAADSRAPSCQLSGLALWPSVRRPRVLVARIRGNDALQALASRFEALSQSLGFAAEQRRFRAHVTLGRLREGAPAFSGSLDPPPPVLRFNADMVTLMESVSGPRRPRYRSLARAALGISAR